MAQEERRFVPLAEGQVTKGGHNPPNQGVARPPAPQGSGGKPIQDTAQGSSVAPPPAGGRK